MPLGFDSRFIHVGDDSKVYQYIKEWKPRLIDLSRRNRLSFDRTRLG
jgi:hypothetical protein